MLHFRYIKAKKFWLLSFMFTRIYYFDMKVGEVYVTYLKIKVQYLIFLSFRKKILKSMVYVAL